jgi:hypothetical protein
MAENSEPLPFRILLDDAARRARRSFVAIYPSVAVPVAAAQLAMVVVQLRWMQGMFGTPQVDPARMFSGVAQFGCAFLVFMVLNGLAYGAMGAAAVAAAAGRPVAMGQWWRFIVRPKVLVTMLGMGLAVWVGMICCLAPGLWLLMLLGFALPVMVEEDLVLGAAWRRSVELARYNPQRQLTTSPMFKVFVFLVVGLALSWAISLTVQMPFLAAQEVLMIREVAGGTDPAAAATSARWLWLQAPSAVLGSLAQTAVALYLSFGMALLYFDVRQRREGGDLEAALDEVLGGGSGAAPQGAGE